MATYGDAHLKIFSLSSNRPLAEKIAASIGVELSKINLAHFSDNEIQVNIEESVRGDNVYIIQSTSAPVNDNLMEVMITIDALRRASAKSINVVLPYYGYARQDRKARSREPITAKLVANMLQMAGATRVLAMDLHAAQIQGFFDIPVDHLMGAPLLADYLLTSGIVDDNTVVVSPDHGGVTRARKLAELLGSEEPIAIIDKRRPKANVAKIMNIIGDVKGKRAIMIDDMIDTGGTITQGAQKLMDEGATEVYVVATHAVFSDDAPERLQNSCFKKVIVTDSIALPEEKKFDKLVQVSTADLIAETIVRINENQAISPLFNSRYHRD
ncbi:ribose-phosphate pyrophosphokinase [Weissella uvarum]|uniref:ribose-phosphate diphosphokinase n=1 Tax=Weissella uvarum TaxID=1479233 RepID=UPI001960810B|nr:ribose-phosphate diphosphokinase [Weissella uvarum]MBM7617643.1 ribose-phosphate pyrophosphokinase [Weissella uvarum]MCM0595992.1 ribose-phosphate diphosphokinase [Weissella uvarum]